MQDILIRYMRDHGHIAWPSGTKFIGVLAPYTRAGRLFHCVEVIPATPTIVRVWLGY